MAGHLLSTTFDHTSAVLSMQEISNVIEKNDLYLHGTQHVQHVLEVLQCMFVVHTGLEATAWSDHTEFLIPSRLSSRHLSAQALRHYLQQGMGHRQLKLKYLSGSVVARRLLGAVHPGLFPQWTCALLSRLHKQQMSYRPLTIASRELCVGLPDGCMLMATVDPKHK